MPRIRSILGACSIEIAQHRRTCHRDRDSHTIPKGTPCLGHQGCDSWSQELLPAMRPRHPGQGRR